MRHDIGDSILTECDCGAQYKTEKNSTAFSEEFNCDRCGRTHKFIVPAMSKTNPSDHLQHGRFDSGMKISEAVFRARNWWETKGKIMMFQNSLRQKNSPAASTPGLGGSFASLDPDNPNFLPSRLLQGHGWDDLDMREQMQIVIIWHDNYVRSAEHQTQSELENLLKTENNLLS